MVCKASRFWSMASWTKMLMPDNIEILNTRVIIRKKKWFGLTGTEEEITYKQISSIRLVKRIFTGIVIIETTGGAMTDIRIKNFTKKTAKKVVGILRGKIENINIKV